MKKISTFIIILIIALNINAQSGFSLSVFGGVNGSGVEIKDDVFKMQDYTGMKTGFSAGLKVQHEFKKPFLVELQSFYNKCGYSLTIPETNLMERIDFSNDFISVSLLLGYNFYLGENDNFSISPKVGVVPSFFVNTSAEFQGENYDAKVDNKVDWRCVLELELAWKVNSVISIFVNVNGRDGWDIITYSNIANVVEGYEIPGIRQYVITGNAGVKIKLTNRDKEFYEF